VVELLIMDANKKINGERLKYLELARDAEKFAQESHDANLREGWLGLAKVYRELADRGVTRLAATACVSMSDRA
jgi:hypothetical protein